VVTKVIIEKNAYYDSVTLMSLSGSFGGRNDVEEVIVSMATQMNKELLENVNMLTEEARYAKENDLIIAIKAKTESLADELISAAREQLNAKKTVRKGEINEPVNTLNTALENLPDANIAVISVPGDFAAREAFSALEAGLHVMIFSDNVTVQEERELKEMGRDSGLLVMGPDCGTAIINQVGLCFANQVRQGEIGLVAASGTGLQEVTVQIDRLGYGISQAIGVGGRDLSDEIGGIMMLEGLRALSNDSKTKVIVLISKPPAPSVGVKMMEQIEQTTKSVVVCFLDGDGDEVRRSGAMFAKTLNQGAILAVESLTGTKIEKRVDHQKEDEQIWIRTQKMKMAKSQKYIRGLFCGGTLTLEALSVIRPQVTKIRSNVAKRSREKLADVLTSEGHTLLDLGDDEFTVGKPHPMIEPSLRNERILQEARDTDTAVLLLDFELGYGSHDDPVGITFSTLQEAKEIAREQGCHLPIVAYVCGTVADKQGYEGQVNKLKSLDIFVAESNEHAAKIATELI
jgi:succinyl-CoA synthetase alpha subunit